jgi:hypothetical protein
MQTCEICGLIRPDSQSVCDCGALRSKSEISRRTKLRVLLVIPLIAATLIPVPYLAAPRWDVTVVDESASPIEGMTVTRVYQNYSTERRGHEEDQITDRQGRTSFPPRWSSASVARRIAFTILALRTGVHASA